MDARLSATAPNAYAAGLYQGQPGSYPTRDVYVAICGDTAEGTGDSKYVIYFVPPSGGPGVQVVQDGLTGSQQKSYRSPLNGEQHVRVQLVSGGPLYVRVYVEPVGS